MALVEMTIASQVLEREVDFFAVLPENTQGMIGMEGKGQSCCPTLYLLHGMSDDHSIWLRRTNIERYAAEKGLAVVMPCADLSFYTDMYMGDRYWTFITKELPGLCRAMFPQLSPRREDTFVAGLSMGGYGALKCGLNASEVFSCAAGLSSVADISETAQAAALASPAFFTDIFGPLSELAQSPNDLFSAAASYAKGDHPPVRFYMWCGTEDRLYPQNVKLKDFMRKLGLDLVYEESTGSHNWKCWDEKIQDILSWLLLGKEAK